MNKRGLVLFIVGLLTTTIRAFAQPSTSPLEWNSRGLTLSDFIVSEAYSDRASNSSIQWLENTRLFRSSEMPWLKIKYSDIKNIMIPEKKKFVFILSLYEQCSFRLGGISHLLPSPTPVMAVELSAGYCPEVL